MIRRLANVIATFFSLGQTSDETMEALLNLWRRDVESEPYHNQDDQRINELLTVEASDQQGQFTPPLSVPAFQAVVRDHQLRTSSEIM